MANVKVKRAGGAVKIVSDVKTVGDVRRKENIPNSEEATLKGEPCTDADEVMEGDTINFAGKVRGGLSL